MNPRRLAPLIVVALAAAALGGGIASGSDGGPTAGASVARCNGKAFSPTQSGRLLTSKGSLTCRGDVAKQRLRTCLEQENNGRFSTVKCDTRVKFGPGTIFAKAQRRCGASLARGFRTRTFLFLRDVSGQKAFGKAISDLRAFPRRCN